VSDCQGEERTLQEASTNVAEFFCVSAISQNVLRFARAPIPGVGILTHFPFAARRDPSTSVKKGKMATMGPNLVVGKRKKKLLFFPFSSSKFDRNPYCTRSRSVRRDYPVAWDRLTRVRPPFARNPSPLQPSRLPLEYLLLPPRSALGPVRPGVTPGGLPHGPHAPLPAGLSRLSAPAARCEWHARAPSIFGAGPFGR